MRVLLVLALAALGAYLAGNGRAVRPLEQLATEPGGRGGLRSRIWDGRRWRPVEGALP